MLSGRWHGPPGRVARVRDPRHHERDARVTRPRPYYTHHVIGFSPVSTLSRFIIAFFVLFFPLLSSAEGPSFPDVPAGAWYEDAVENFVQEQYLDASQPRFRGGDRAARAEFVKLVVELNGGILVETPSDSHFSDVSPGDWFFPYLEEAAREGWVKGDNDCFGAAPCKVRPRDPISRAEAAALVRRAFGKKPIGKAPAFADNPPGSWFHEVVQIAADHCILRGDDASRNVRPASPLNRAEMVVMLFRVDEGRKYPNC